MARVTLLTLLLHYACTAQPALSFFPHSEGNMWEYYWVEGSIPVDTLQSFMYLDSVGIDGRIYTTMDSRFINPVMQYWTEWFVIDTAVNQVWGDLGFGFGLLHKLDAQQGEQWVMKDYGGGSYEMCRVVSVRQSTVLGIPTTTKDYSYFLASDSTDTLGLSREGRSLSSGFGLTYRGGGDLFFYISIKGAVIDSSLYGDTTSVVTSVPEFSPDLPTQFELSHNYPNPFNPSTNIRFNLPLPERIPLIIYDRLGREIRRLIDNEEFDYGPHEITWDGKTNFARDAASGVYYCHLFGGENSITRSMVLLR